VILEFSIIFVVALILIKLIIINALKLGLVDVPNERSIHTRHHPRGAGIGIYLAVALVDPWFNLSILIEHYMALLAVLLVFIVGVLDDHQDTSQNTKFFVMTIDGLDGLAGSISIVILSTLFMIGYDNGDDFMMMLSGSFIAALLAFMVYNWNPASIFMGDSGSLVLGFVIGLLVIKSASYIQPVSVLFIIAVPLLDTIIVMFRRMRQGKSMFTADKTHIHHVLFNFFNHDAKRTVVFLSILQLTYSVTGLLIVDSADQTMSLVLFALNASILYFVFSGMLRRQTVFDKQTKEKP
jgi:UDP-GlcNAc:undecaprenyl-phosphate GlcNAc-1-phosphate transferase